MSHAERGILSLVRRPSWIPDTEDASPLVLRSPLQSDMALSWSYPEGYLTGNCTAITDLVSFSWNEGRGQVISMEPSIGIIFNGIINETGFAASALSALITILSASVYYDRYPQYEISTQVEQIFSVQTLVPKLTRGYFAVVTLLLLHLLVVIHKVHMFHPAWQFLVRRGPAHECGDCQCAEQGDTPGQIRSWIRR